MSRRDSPRSAATPAATPVSPDTKEALLDAAELLCAERGVAGASLRAITARAGANLAAANYHFGSKDALVRAMLARRLRPVNRQRIELLDAAERAHDGAPPLAEVVHAFLAPLVTFGRELPDGGRNFARLCGRALGSPDPTLGALLREELGEVLGRFGAAFQRALPELSREELMWRIHFVIGAVSHALAGGELIRAVSGGVCDPDDRPRILEHLVAFACGGLAAAPARQGASC